MSAKRKGKVRGALQYSAAQQKGGTGGPGKQAATPTPQPKPKPVARKIDWTPLPSVEYGTELTVTLLKGSATGEGGELRLEFPKGPLAVGQGGPNVCIVAPGKEGVTLEARETATIAVTPAPRSITFKAPAAPILIGTALTPELFEAKPSAGPGSVAISQPAGGLAAAEGKQTAVLTLAAAGNYGPATENVPIEVILPEREVDWSLPPSIVFGTELTVAGVSGVAPGEGDPPRLEFPNGPLQVGQAGPNLRIVAPGKPGVSRDGVKTATVPVTPAPRTVTYKSLPKSRPIRLGETLTPELFAAAVSAGTGTVVVAEPAGGNVTARGALDIKLQPQPDPNYADTPVIIKVDVVQGQPEITWPSPASVVKGVTIGPTQLNATINPPTLAGSIRYTMVVNQKQGAASGQVMNGAGQFFIKARFPGNDDYRPVEKEVRLTVTESAAAKMGADAMAPGQVDANWHKPTDAGSTQKLQDWDDDAGGMQTQAKEVMASIQNMTEREIIKYCNKLKGVKKKSQGGTYPNELWLLPNGLQLRLKPDGDKHKPSKQFCIEAVKGSNFSDDLNDIAFKVTASGEPAPKHPGELRIPGGGTTAQRADFVAGASGATHLKCQPMQPNQITWGLAPNAEIKRGADISDLLNATALGGAAVDYLFDKMVLKEKKISLAQPSGKLIARSAETDKYTETRETRDVRIALR
jgi:hypothetical protein